mgnify:CR=1 FL=1
MKSKRVFAGTWTPGEAGALDGLSDEDEDDSDDSHDDDGEDEDTPKECRSIKSNSDNEVYDVCYGVGSRSFHPMKYCESGNISVENI